MEFIKTVTMTQYARQQKREGKGGMIQENSIETCILPYDPTIPLLGIYPKETITEKDTYTPMFIATLFTIARTWKQCRCPSADE